MPSTTPDNPEIVRQMYDAFSRKDESALRQLLDADVEWVQCAGFPGGKHRHGVDEVLSGVLRGLNSEWRGFSVDIDEILEAGDRVVALGRYSGEHATTGRWMTSVFAHVYDVADGRITRFRQFADTHEIVRAGVA